MRLVVGVTFRFVDSFVRRLVIRFAVFLIGSRTLFLVLRIVHRFIHRLVRRMTFRFRVAVTLVAVSPILGEIMIVRRSFFSSRLVRTFLGAMVVGQNRGGRGCCNDVESSAGSIQHLFQRRSGRVWDGCVSLLIDAER